MTASPTDLLAELELHPSQAPEGRPPTWDVLCRFLAPTVNMFWAREQKVNVEVERVVEHEKAIFGAWYDKIRAEYDQTYVDPHLIWRERGNERARLRQYLREYQSLVVARYKKATQLRDEGKLELARAFVLHCTVLEILRRLRHSFPHFPIPDQYKEPFTHHSNIHDLLGPGSESLSGAAGSTSMSLGRISHRAARIYGHASPSSWRAHVGLV